MDDNLFERFLNGENISSNDADNSSDDTLFENTNDDLDFLNNEELSDLFFKSLEAEIETSQIANDGSTDTVEIINEIKEDSVVDTFIFGNNLQNASVIELEEIINDLSNANIFEIKNTEE